MRVKNITTYELVQDHRINRSQFSLPQIIIGDGDNKYVIELNERDVLCLCSMIENYNKEIMSELLV